jgi:tetratricopeptide (TPR) repeat protein
MRNLLAIMLVFVMFAAAAVWWGSSVLVIAPASNSASSEPSGASEQLLLPAEILPQTAQPTAIEAAPLEPTPTSDPVTVPAAEPGIETAAPEETSFSPARRMDPLVRAEQALQQDPLHPLALRDAARLTLERGQSRDAERYLARLLIIDPNDIEVRQALAELAAKREAWSTVLDVLEPSGPARLEPEQLRMYARACLATGRLRDAQAAWSRVIAQDAEDWGARLEYAAVLIELNELDLAVNQLQAVLAARPRSVPALNMLALLHWQRYEQSDRLDQAARRGAIEAWRQALAIDPSQPEVTAQLAAIERGEF